MTLKEFDSWIDWTILFWLVDYVAFLPVHVPLVGAASRGPPGALAFTMVGHPEPPGPVGPPGGELVAWQGAKHWFAARPSQRA